MFGVYRLKGESTMEEFAASTHMKRSRPIERPLLGLTILLVEDSRYFSDAVRLMSIRSGARLRRADCLQSARKHIRIYRPDAVLVDLGLPDGSGREFIREVAQSPTSPPIIAMSGEADESKQQRAIGAGAVMFLQKPFFDLASFQQTVLSVLSDSSGAAGFKPRMAGDQVLPDGESLREDFDQIHAIIQEAMPSGDAMRIKYCAQFLASVAQVSGDQALVQETEVLNARLREGAIWSRSCERVLALLDERLAA
jgi:DNA-binding response OmpR family regulator